MKRSRWALLLVGLTGLYVLAGKGGLYFAALHVSASAVWPPAGIALAAGLIFGARVWPTIFVGAFIVNLTTAGSVATSLGIALGNTLEALLGTFLVNRFASGRAAFDRAQDIIKFAGLAGLGSTAIGATMGVTSLALAGFAPWSGYGAIWLTWWLGDAAGALVVAPLLVLWSLPRATRWTRQQYAEAGVLFLSLVVISIGIFVAPLFEEDPLAFVCLSPLLWAAFRFGQREVATAIGLLTLIATWATLIGRGPFVMQTLNESLLVLQAFMATMVLTVLPVAALVWERRRAEAERESLRQVAERERAWLEAVVRHMPAGVIIAEAPSGRLVLYNEQARQIWKHTTKPTDLIEAYGLYRGFHPDGRPYQPEDWPLGRAIRTGEAVIDKRIGFIRGDGSTGTMSSSAAPIQDAEGRIVAAVVVFHDVTAQTRADERFRLAVEAAPNAMIMVDAAGRIALANLQAEQLFGYRRDELIGQPVEILVPERFRTGHPGDRYGFVADPRTRAMGTGRDLYAVRRDGTEVAVEIGLNPIKTEAGLFVLAAVVDITERKRAEQERVRLLVQEQAARARAQTAEARFAFLGEIAASITSSLDLEAVLQRIVDGARELCSSDLAAILLRDGASNVMVPRYRAGGTSRGSYEAFRIEPGESAGGRVLLDHQPFRTADYRAELGFTYAADGVAEPPDIVSLMVVPILIHERAEGLLYVSNHTRRPFSDEDELICVRLAAHAAIAIQNAQLFAGEQAARAEAEAANHAKDRFLAVLSHELRTPLNAMMGWVKILRQHPLDETQRRHALEVIERNTGMQAQLINDLLDVSRIIAGKLELECYPVDLLPVIQDAVDGLRAAAEAQGVTLASELDARVGDVMGDPRRLHQIVTNILSNAVKFTPRHGRVEVTLARHGAKARLTVGDTGEGIAAEDLPHIFEPFRQADSSSSRRHQGLGLGLAIARQLVEQQGGGIRAESAGKGRGATFTVEFPIVAVLSSAVHTAPASANLEAPANRLRLDGVRVLIVDDQPDSRELVGVVLQNAGADVALAGSTAEALNLLEQRPIEVLVSDLAMPGADGYDLIIRLRRLERERARKTIRAMALTAYADAGARERALGAGFEAYATKPIHPEILIEMIAKLSLP